MGSRRKKNEGDGVVPSPSLSEINPLDTSTPEYEIIGVKRTPDSKIWFHGQYWHLDRLTPEDVNYLSSFPEEFPYLKIG